MPIAGEKKSRLVTRVPSGVRKAIEAAADLQGSGINQFIVQAAYRQAQEVLERESIIRLNREQTQHVFALVENPPKPAAALLAARAEHRKRVRA